MTFTLPPGVEVPDYIACDPKTCETKVRCVVCAEEALAALCRVIREQDRMLTDACDILAADDEERVTKVMHDLGFIEENRWGPMYDAEAFNAMLRSRVREEAWDE